MADRRFPSGIAKIHPSAPLDLKPRERVAGPIIHLHECQRTQGAKRNAGFAGLVDDV